MRLLIDTHILLWVMSDELSQNARNVLDAASSVYVSSASIWEIAIKSRLGKLPIDVDQVRELIVEAGFQSLPINDAHAAMTYHLPALHHDPFDRLLVAQAEVEQLRLITADAQVAAYSDRIILV